jgi:hypothetical protein
MENPQLRLSWLLHLSHPLGVRGNASCFPLMSPCVTERQQSSGLRQAHAPLLEEVVLWGPGCAGARQGTSRSGLHVDPRGLPAEGPQGRVQEGLPKPTLTELFDLGRRLP